ncbi:MAG: DUF4159 domain-containing protein [Bryobacteraceae bacterium]|nr:DUF4159 domain-containing protein [Bryobacteraceae bacterium]
MRFRTIVRTLLALALVLTSVFALQRRRLPNFMDEEDNPAPIPADANEKTEYTFARLRYPSDRFAGWGRGAWTTDYPKADRQFVQGLRRLSRVHTRSVEHVVDLDSDDIFNYPWIYAVEVGHWSLDDAQAAKLREYLLRGGFLMTDDFHGTLEWQVFMASMSRVFPDRPIVDLPNGDAAFHVLYDLDERFQVPGIQYFYTSRIWERDGVDPQWKGIYDDKGRLMVAICHNMDLGDAWEHADHPQYPEKYASLAYRVAINYIIYSMTH